MLTMQTPTFLLQLLLIVIFQVHLNICEVNNCYPESHKCPFNDSDSISGVVTPTLPPSDCPGPTCQLLECYLTCFNNTDYKSISLYALPGVHQGRHIQVYTSIHDGLTIIGINGPQIQLTNFKLIAKLNYTGTCNDGSNSCWSTVYMDSLVVNNVDIVAHCYLGSPCSTEISNSVFNEASITLSNAVVSLYNLQFHNSTSTALTLYFSRTVIEGSVSFVNNTGANGGAMALIGSLLRFTNVDVNFKQNRARKNGGALFIDSTVSGFATTSCFYGIYMGTSNDSIQFEENSAVQSGDHIYGTSMKSTCYEFGTNTPSYEIVKKYFEFKPYFNDTLSSAISGLPSRVCICSGTNATPQCANPSNINNPEIKIYPGESFTICAVVVGGDFGTTTGTVYASIETLDNSTDYVPTLEAPHMYNQVISKNRECTELQYTILSNITGITIVLSLRTIETSENVVPDNIAELCRRYHTEEVISPELMTTPVVIPLTIQSCPIGFTLVGNSLDRCDCYNCLLYTSPSPRDATLSRMPSSA